MRQAALVFGRGQIDVNPGHAGWDEARQETRRQDVVPFVLDGALLYIRDRALELLVVVLRPWRERPDPLAALLTGRQ